MLQVQIDQDLTERKQASSRTRKIAIRKRIIRAKYRAAKRDRAHARNLLSGLREREFERLLIDTYGGELPDDDAGRDDLRSAFLILLSHRDGAYRVRMFASVWAPWLSEEEREAMLADAIALPSWRRAEILSAEALGRALGLTNDVRKRLCIRTIRACDVTAEQVTAMKRERDRKYQAKRRAEQRAARVASLSRSRPWLAEGISRRTWERRRAGNSKRHQSIENSKPWETAGVSRRTWFRRKATGTKPGGTKRVANPVGHNLKGSTRDAFCDRSSAKHRKRNKVREAMALRTEPAAPVGRQISDCKNGSIEMGRAP